MLGLRLFSVPSFLLFNRYLLLSVAQSSGSWGSGGFLNVDDMSTLVQDFRYALRTLARTRDLPQRPSSRWRSASARPRRCSPSWTACC